MRKTYSLEEIVERVKITDKSKLNGEALELFEELEFKLANLSKDLNELISLKEEVDREKGITKRGVAFSGN